jgi:hypothetical protein
VGGLLALAWFVLRNQLYRPSRLWCFVRRGSLEPEAHSP